MVLLFLMLAQTRGTEYSVGVVCGGKKGMLVHIVRDYNE